MKHLFFFLFAVIAITALNAKNDSIPVNDSLPREYKNRNEIYLNLSPVLIPMLGGSQDLIKYSIRYKRRDITLNRAFRVAINYVKTQNPESYRQHLYDHDSVMVLQKISDESSSNVWVDFGWEFIQYYKRFERFFGVDIGLGRYQSSMYLHQELYNINNGLYVQSIYENIKYSNTENRVGISPFFGLRYHMSEHFLLSIQAGVDINYSMIHSTSTKSADYDETRVDFKLGTPAFINDIAIAYTF